MEEGDDGEAGEEGDSAGVREVLLSHPPCWEICWETLSLHPRGEPRLISGYGWQADHKAVMFSHVENSLETTLAQVCM